MTEWLWYFYIKLKRENGRSLSDAFIMQENSNILSREGELILEINQRVKTNGHLEFCFGVTLKSWPAPVIFMNDEEAKMKIFLDGKYSWYTSSLTLFESKALADNDLCMFEREHKELDKDQTMKTHGWRTRLLSL